MFIYDTLISDFILTDDRKFKAENKTRIALENKSLMKRTDYFVEDKTAHEEDIGGVY